MKKGMKMRHRSMTAVPVDHTTWFNSSASLIAEAEVTSALHYYAEVFPVEHELVRQESRIMKFLRKLLRGSNISKRCGGYTQPVTQNLL